jgi:hypothetical protein
MECSMRRHLLFPASIISRILPGRFPGFIPTAVSFTAILCSALSGRAAFEHVEVGARPAALGGAYCALSDDVHGPLYNPAGASWSQRRALALSGCRPFGLGQLDTGELSILQPVLGWVFGLHARHFGDRLYRETTVAMSAAHRFLDRLSAGGCLRGLQLSIDGYGSDETWSLDVGILALPGDRWRWGMAVHNINNGRLGRARQGMPQVLMVGLACRPEERVWLSGELLGDLTDLSVDSSGSPGYPLEWRLGCEARPGDALALRLGLQNHPMRISAGLELAAGRLRLGYAWRSHVLLGSTHHITLMAD